MRRTALVLVACFAALWLQYARLTPTRYYIDLTGVGSGAKNGNNAANQCAGLDDADCAEAPGGVYYLCNTAPAGTDIDVPASGTDALNRIDYDGSCPGGTPGKLVMGRIFGTGRDYWGVHNLTIEGSDEGQSAIAVFVCEESNGGACPGREGTGTGFQATGNTIINAGKSGIEIGTIANQTSYGATEEVVITGNTIRDPAAHGISMNAFMVSPTEGNNTVIGANQTGGFNSWGIYASPRAYNYTGNWTSAGANTCASSSQVKYYVTLGSDVTGLGADEIVEQVILGGIANGHYTEQVVGSCTGIANRRWCQTGSQIHICPPVSDLPAGVMNDRDVVIVTSDFGPMTMGAGDEVSGTRCFPNSSGTCTKDGTGIGGDIGAKNLTIERAYSHDNEGRGVEFNMCPAGCVARSNISAYNGTWGFLVNNVSTATDTVSWYHNLAYGNRSEPFRISNTGGNAVQAYGNIAIGAGSQNCLNVSISGGGEGGNFYASCTATHFPTATTGDPLFAGGSNPTSVDDFRPLRDSDLFGTGWEVPNTPDFDGLEFTGRPTPGPFNPPSAANTISASNRLVRTPETTVRAQ